MVLVKGEWFDLYKAVMLTNRSENSIVILTEANLAEIA